MAATCFGQSDSETPELDTFDVEAAAPPGAPPPASPEQPVAAPLQAGPQAPAPSPQPHAIPAARQGPPAPGAAPLGGLPGAAPSTILEDAALPIEQMRLTVEYGLLMVLGPEGDPVPPYAFAAAAVARPDALVGLPDGTKAVASRVAAVLGAQILGRLGKTEQGAEWILAMLRDGGRPEHASEAALRAEQDGLGADEGPAADAGALAAGREPEHGDRTATREHERTPAGEADAAPPPQPDGDLGYREALDQASLDRAAASITPSPEALPKLELDLDELVASPDAALDLDFSADAFGDRPGGEPDDMLALMDPADMRRRTLPAMASPDATSSHSVSPDFGSPASGTSDSRAPGSSAPDRDGPGSRAPDWSLEHGSAPQRPDDGASVASGPAAAEAGDAECNVDPDSLVLVVMRGVPANARLSSGMRDDDGSWSISPLDLSTVMIGLASQGSDNGAEDRSVDCDLSITGIAFAEDGELVAVSETVPLADYLDDPASADPAPMQPAAKPAGDLATEPAPRMIALEVDQQAWAGDTFDALLIRDLPAGARLSAGAHDPAIDGWVLRPQDLSGLAILPPPDLRADFTLTLMGVALRPGDADAARVLARLPVRLG